MSAFDVPLFIRGKLIQDNWVESGNREGNDSFRAPHIHQYVDELPLSSPMALGDLYEALVKGKTPEGAAGRWRDLLGEDNGAGCAARCLLRAVCGMHM